MENRKEYATQFLKQCEEEMDSLDAIPLCLVSIEDVNNKVFVKWDRGSHGKRMSDYLRQVADMIDRNEI